MEEIQQNPKIEKILKVIFYVLIGVPVVWLIAFLSLVLLRFEGMGLAGFLLAYIPFPWMMFLTIVFVVSLLAVLFPSFRKHSIYYRQVKKILVLTIFELVAILFLACIFIVPMIDYHPNNSVPSYPVI